MIRTLQDHGIHQGIDVYMETTVLTLLTNDGRAVGAFGYTRERGRFILFRPTPLSWLQAALAGHTRSTATVGNTPATVMRSHTTRALI